MEKQVFKVSIIVELWLISYIFTEFSLFDFEQISYIILLCLLLLSAGRKDCSKLFTVCNCGLNPGAKQFFLQPKMICKYMPNGLTKLSMHWLSHSFMCREYFRKAGHACSMNKNGHTLVNLGQFEDETPLKKNANLKVL